MSALREQIEGNGQALLNVHKRIDALVLAQADLFRKLEAATAILGAAPDQDCREEFLVLLDTTHSEGIFAAEAKMAALNPEALAKFIQSREESKRRGERISTDKSPRQATALRDGLKARLTDERGRPLVKDRYGHIIEQGDST